MTPAGSIVASCSTAPGCAKSAAESSRHMRISVGTLHVSVNRSHSWPDGHAWVPTRARNPELDVGRVATELRDAQRSGEDEPHRTSISAARRDELVDRTGELDDVQLAVGIGAERADLRAARPS